MKRVALVTGLGAAFLMAGIACSGSATNFTGPSCGPGTVVRDGECVVAPPEGGDDGATPTDAFASDGTVEDRTSPDGDDEGGEDASSPPEVEPPDDGTPADQTAPDGPLDDANYGSDDPCPVSPLNINCSTSCGPMSAECASLRCPSEDAAGLFDVSSVSQLPFVIRTPSPPFGVQSCLSCPPVVDMNVVALVALKVSASAGNIVAVNVGPPWKVNAFNATCGPPLPCNWVPNWQPHVMVWTDDPNAPARNIVIAEVPDAQPCQ